MLEGTVDTVKVLRLVELLAVEVTIEELRRVL